MVNSSASSSTYQQLGNISLSRREMLSGLQELVPTLDKNA